MESSSEAVHTSVVENDGTHILSKDMWGSFSGGEEPKKSFSECLRHQKSEQCQQAVENLMDRLLLTEFE